MEVAFVLPADSAQVAEPVVFPDVPGVWTAGEPKVAAAVGLSVQEMRDKIKEFDLPLKETKADGKDTEKEIARHAGMVSGADLDSEPLGLAPGPDVAAEHADAVAAGETPPNVDEEA